MNSQNQKQIKSWYQAQKNGQWKTLTNSLAYNEVVQTQLNKFITTIYQKFRQQKNLSENHKTFIKFQGFQGFQDFPEPTKMGHCDSKLNWKSLNGQKVANSESGSLSIVLSQKLLLSKLGISEFISNYQENTQGAQWESLPVSFDELISTIAHELAHAYQFLINEDEIKSQCESTGKRDSQGQLVYPQLAYEHTALTNEIKTLITTSPEHQKFQAWWKAQELKGPEWQKLQAEPTEPKTDEPISKTSQEAIEKTSEITTQKLEPTSQDKWPSWVLPVGIISGALLLLGIIYQLFKKR